MNFEEWFSEQIIVQPVMGKSIAREALKVAWDASRKQALEEAAKACEEEADYQWSIGRNGSGADAARRCGKEIRAIE